MRLEIVETGRRRRFSEAEKIRILAESFSGWRQALATARRHGNCQSLLFRWHMLWRSGQLGGRRTDDRAVTTFVPAIIVPNASEKGAVDGPVSIDGSKSDDVASVSPAVSPALVDARIEIIVPGGYRVLVGGGVDGDAPRRVLAVVAGQLLQRHLSAGVVQLLEL